MKMIKINLSIIIGSLVIGLLLHYGFDLMNLFNHHWQLVILIIYAFVAKFPFVIRRFVNKLKIFHEDKKYFIKRTYLVTLDWTGLNFA